MKLKDSLSAVLSADYHMQKLVPYHLQKLSHVIFAIVNHSDEHSTVYIFDETVGAKKH